MEIYIVQPGDTVDDIAAAYGINAEAIIYGNQLVYPYPLAIGQALLIPNSAEEMGQGERRELYSSGYAYPFIEGEILNETLPYLTSLFIFSYGFTMEGELVPPLLSEEWMLERAYWSGVGAILTLTPLGADGRFNNHLVTAILENPQAKENLIQQLFDKVREKGYQGVDVDFEYVKAEDRDLFTDFVAELTRRMNQEGYQVSVALAPKTSADQKGLLYEGKDYGGLGAAANQVLLMTYEWGYTYGPPMAVAPINKVRQVVEYAVTEIPVRKINMGIPNYGYDWPLPYEKGVTRARTIGNVEAVRLAVEQGAVIQFDPVAQSPYFVYIQDGIEHEVWFEDVRSIQAKFGLVREFALKGVGYWQLMRLFRANWLLMEEEFRIEKNLI